MITKDFCTYKRIMLRRDKTLRDHGRAAVRRVAGAHLDLIPLVPGPGTLPHPGHPLWGPQLTILNILTGDLDLTTTLCACSRCSPLPPGWPNARILLALRHGLIARPRPRAWTISSRPKGCGWRRWPAATAGGAGAE